jgi:hypothetical protein
MTWASWIDRHNKHQKLKFSFEVSHLPIYGLPTYIANKIVISFYGSIHSIVLSNVWPNV